MYKYRPETKENKPRARVDPMIHRLLTYAFNDRATQKVDICSFNIFVQIKL